MAKLLINLTTSLMKKAIISFSILSLFSITVLSQLIVDHTCTDITQIPQSAIEQAKRELHIAYGHTSHGSQVTEGMTDLVGFANGGGRGISFSTDMLAWNNGGTDDALDLDDYAMGGDVGYWPDWYNNTIAYLDDPDNSDVNVIIWSWCGQVGDKYENGHLLDEFLAPMSQLENTYPNVTFVYMTGHLDYWGRENTNAANDSIRSYCQNNNKVLFDFADIESYGPDGTIYKNDGDDACNYYDSGDNIIGNWAQEYQNTHTEGVDWFTCGSQHTEPFNANLKSYAAWHLFASLGGWNYTPPPPNPVGTKNIETAHKGLIYPNPANDQAIFEIIASIQSGIRVDLININGAIIESNISPFSSYEKLVFKIDTKNLNPGVYYLSVTSDTKKESYKLMVVQ